VDQVLAQKVPPIFKLVNILNEPVPGYFYREELTKSEPLDYSKDYFMVEKIVKTKYVKGTKYCLLKYLFYPSRFNEWVKDSDIKRSTQ